ncbi:MAG: gamma carbonic anhydrase family protein [Solirubrobacterales bacterium]
MALYEFEGKRPTISREAFVHPEAVLIGDVVIGARCYIGAGTVMRGDTGTIVIGDGSNIQDGCVLHTEPGTRAVIGQDCLIGHCVMLHGPLEMGDRVMVGMSATVLAGCELGEGCAVAAGSLVKQNARVAAGKMMMGLPAKEVGEITENAAIFTDLGVKLYQDLAARSLASMKRIENPAECMI